MCGKPRNLGTDSIDPVSHKEFEWYQELWRGSKGNAAKEAELDALFREPRIQNTDPEKVKGKIEKLNAHYSVRVYRDHQEIMRDVICELDIDEALRAGDVGLVGRIVTKGGERIERKGGKKRLYYSFVTKYCAFHNPPEYCLFDRYARTALKTLTGWKLTDIGCRGYQLRCYPQYHHAMETFQQQAELTERSFRGIDHYLWFKGQGYEYPGE